MAPIYTENLLINFRGLLRVPHVLRGEKKE